MAYPTGSGSEQLRRGLVHALATTDTSFKFDGTNPSTGTSSYAVPALHIITIVSVIFNNQSAADAKFYMKVVDAVAFHGIIEEILIPTKGTFVFSDKFVLIGGDALVVKCTTGTNIDIVYSYIDQDWT